MFYPLWSTCVMSHNSHWGKSQTQRFCQHTTVFVGGFCRTGSLSGFLRHGLTLAISPHSWLWWGLHSPQVAHWCCVVLSCSQTPIPSHGVLGCGHECSLSHQWYLAFSLSHRTWTWSARYLLGLLAIWHIGWEGWPMQKTLCVVQCQQWLSGHIHHLQERPTWVEAQSN